MNANFTKKKINTFTLGERLKKRRKSLGINLAEVSRVTHIQERYLRSLEREEWKDLPPDVYVQGFLKVYAEYLDLDPEEVIQEYLKMRKIYENGVKKPGDSSVKYLKSPRFVITPKFFWISFSIFLVLVAFAYIWYQISSFASAPKLELEKPGENEVINDNSLTLVGLTEPDVTLTVNDQPILIDLGGRFQETISLQEGINKIVVRAESRSGKRTEITREIAVHLPSKPEGERQEDVTSPSAEASLGVNIIVRIKNEPTWISIDVDEKHVFDGVMLPGSSQEFQGEKVIAITSGKGNQTEIVLNGKERGTLSDNPGVVRDVKFTSQTKAPE